MVDNDKQELQDYLTVVIRQRDEALNALATANVQILGLRRQLEEKAKAVKPEKPIKIMTN